MKLRRFVVALVVIAAVLPAGDAAAATRVVSFDDRAANERVTDQYKASHGVYFEGSIGFPPKARDAAGARSQPKVAIIDCDATVGDDCGEVGNAPPSTTGQLTTEARSITVYVGAVGYPEDPTRSVPVKLEGYAASGQLVGSDTVTLIGTQPFTHMLRVSSSAVGPGIAYFVVSSDSIGAGAGVGFDDLTIEVPDAPPPPDFNLRLNPTVVNMRQSQSATVAINVNRLNGSNGDISFSVSGLPPGVSGSVSPNPVGGTGSNATLTLTAADDAPAPFTYTEVTVRGTPGPGAGTSERTATTLVRVAENCDRTVRFEYVDARTDGCIRNFGGRYVTVNQDVFLNGLILKPIQPNPTTGENDRTLTIDANEKTISSHGDIYSISVRERGIDIPLWIGTINWDFTGEGTGPRKVAERDISGLKIKQIPVSKIAIFFLRDGKARVDPTLRLAFFPFNHLGALTATTSFRTDNDNGADLLAGLDVKIDKVILPVIELRDVRFKWAGADNWGGGARVKLPFAAPYEVEAFFGLKDGAFDYLRGGVGNLNVAIGPAIFLQRIAMEVHRSPFSLRGEIGFSGGPSVAGKKAVTVNGGFTSTIADPWMIRIDANAYLAESFELGEAFVQYSSDGFLQAGAQVDWNLGPGYIDGRADGWVDRNRAFNFELAVSACIRIWGPDPCANAAAIASSVGIAACIDLWVFSGGLGYRWDSGGDLFSGCDLSSWRATRSAARTAAETRQVQLPAGLPGAAIEVEGAGAAPAVTATGPNGETVSASRDAPLGENGSANAIFGEGEKTYVLLRRPAGGTWTITTADGSPAIRNVRVAHGLPEPSVRARVSGGGAQRTLSWSLRPIPGQRVRFVEMGEGVRRVIATTTDRRGSVRFRPGLGVGRRRTIVALVEQEGVPRANLTVGSYTAPPRPRPGKPRALRINRRGNRLVVTWRPPRRGFRHAVHVRLTDRRSLLRVVPASRRRVVIRRVNRRTGARVTVTGLTRVNARGPAARASIRAVRRRR